MPLPRRRSALGFSQPLGGFGRDDAREPGLPRTHAYAAATPRNDAALFHAAGVLGIRPSELSPLGEPCRLSTAVASLRVRRRSRSGAKTPAISDRFHQRAPPGATTSDPLREPRRRLGGGRRLPRPSCQVAASERASCPARPSSTTNRNLRAPPTRGRHARFEALLPPRVRSPTDRASRRGSRARACAPTRRGRPGRCSLGISPLQSLLRHVLGFGSSASRARGEPDAPRKTTPHSGCRERRFDPEV
jgi:hypothetical protein